MAEKKLPFIVLWGNLLLGDLRRYNPSYNFQLPDAYGKTIADQNKTNATVEQFFNLKKKDRLKERLQLHEFIKKSYKDNLGIRRQFVIGVEEGLKESKKHEYIDKKVSNRLKRLIVDVENAIDQDDEFLLDKEKPCKIEEKWNKDAKKLPKKNSRTQGFYQKAPAFPLHFSATKSEKLSNNSLNHDKTSKCKGKAPLPKTPVRETIQKMQHGCPTKDPSPVSNMDIGYTAFKRKIYRDVERESSGMAEIRKRLRNSWERLSSEEKLIFKNEVQADTSVCFLCKSESTMSRRKDIDWISCDQCLKWYHLECVFIDNHYANTTMTFTCHLCCKNIMFGLPAFLYHYRNMDIDSIDALISIWQSIENETVRKIICDFVYPSIEVGRRLIIAPGLVIERGIVNPYNNCWSNSVIQVLCSSVIRSALPNIEDCPTLVCRYIHKIMSDLHGGSSSAKAGLTMTMEMRKLIEFF